MTLIKPTIEQFLADLYRQDVQLWLDGERLRCNAPEDVLTDALGQELKTRKTEIIAFLQQSETIVDDRTIPAVSRTEALPLSFAQQRLWFLEQMQQGVYNIPFAIRVEGQLDISLLEKCLNAIVQRHEVLRTNFVMQEGEPHQVIQDQRTVQINLINLEDDSDLEAITDHSLAAARHHFDLTQDLLMQVTLLQLNPEEFVVLLTLHHIIADGWSIDLLLQELTQLYRAFLTGQPSPLEDLPVQYADFSAWQRQYLQGETLDRHLNYWRSQLGGELPVLQLPTDHPRARVQNFQGAVVNFDLSPATVNRLKALARLESTTLYTVLLTTFKVLLYRYTGQTDVIVGTPVANRTLPEVEGLIGFFINTLVLRTHINPHENFRDLLLRVKGTLLNGLEHQDLPFEKLVEDLQPVRDLSYNPLFQVKFRLENLPQQTLDLPGMTLKPLPRVDASAKLDLSLDLYETSQGLLGGFEYNRDLFEPETMERMAKHFQVLLEGISAQQPIGVLPLLTDEERHQLLEEWNDTQKPYQSDCCFPDLFESQVKSTPNATALIFDQGEQSPVIELSYQELNERSNQLAHHLKELGVGPEVIVGICLPRSPEMIIALLAVLKAGGAYLPLDTEYPADRLNYMLNDAQVRVLLSHSEVALDNIPTQTQRLNLNTDWPETAPKINLTRQITPENLAYLIYTSGSTGLPKGVLIPHRGLVNLTEDKIRVCDIRPDDCVLQFFSFSFDASIPEIIMSLAVGAKLLLSTPEILLPGPKLSQLLKRQSVTHITITPSALLSVPQDDYPNLRMVLVGGEAPSQELINTWGQDRRFINAYGPTETTVNASMVDCTEASQAVLRPSTNKQLYILDSQLQLLPVGLAGELHIAGVGLARGYLNRPDLTSERFIPNPFNQSDSAEFPKNLLYKTGDLACLEPNGDIRILGRIDNQTKIRGFRIEPGEVETILNQHPQIKTSLVIVREDNPGEKRLVAYLIGHDSDSRMPMNELRQFVAETLPHYMVPSGFVWLAQYPLTPNGKVDTKALPQPERQQSEQTAPRSTTESTLFSIFQQVLNQDSLGVHDDFFDLGGHSLLATQLVAQCLNQFDVELTVIDLFEAPSVAELAQRIEQKQILAELNSDVLTQSDEEWEEVIL